MSEKYKKIKKILPIAALATAVAVIIILSVAYAVSKNSSQYSQTVGLGKPKEPQTLLLLGEDNESGLCDVIMLAHIDVEKSRIAIMQIPRDTYARYTDKSYKKLNAAPTVLGEEGTCTFLSNVLGIEIDGFVRFDLEALGAAVDAIGGVEVELVRELEYEGYRLPVGKQTLDGRGAQLLVRYRSGYAGGDIERLDAQKMFMTAFFQKLRTEVNAKNAYLLATQFLPMVKTNVSAMDALSLGLSCLDVPTENVSVFTMPGGAAVARESGASYYVMAKNETRDVLCRQFCLEIGEIDKEGLLLHPKYTEFQRIYNGDES